MEDPEQENELRNIQTQLNHLLMISPVVIYTAEIQYPFSVTYISDNVVFQTGYESHEFIEDPGFWLKKIHPDDLPYVLLEFERMPDTGRVTYEYRLLHKDGTYRWISDGSIFVKDDDGRPLELFGYFQDITRWREADEAIRKSEERYRALAEASHDFIFVINREDVIEYVNNYASQAVHIPVEEIVGKTRSILFPAESQIINTRLFRESSIQEIPATSKAAFQSASRKSGWGPGLSPYGINKGKMFQ